MTYLNNIFSQFNPLNGSFLVLTFLVTSIAMTWILFINKTHWAPTQLTIIPYIISNLSNNQACTTTNHFNLWGRILIAVFFLCVSYNLMSMIPYTFSQTAHFSITFSLSLTLWLSLQILGIIKNWKNKVSHLVPSGTPWYLVPILIIIELISLCIQPLTLGFRLGANLLAGHLLLYLCSCAVWNLINGIDLGLLSILPLLGLFILEFAVGIIQAAVFFMLAKSYLNDNLPN